MGFNDSNTIEAYSSNDRDSCICYDPCSGCSTIACMGSYCECREPYFNDPTVNHAYNGLEENNTSASVKEGMTPLKFTKYVK